MKSKLQTLAGYLTLGLLVVGIYYGYQALCISDEHLADEVIDRIDIQDIIDSLDLEDVDLDQWFLTNIPPESEAENREQESDPQTSDEDDGSTERSQLEILSWQDAMQQLQNNGDPFTVVFSTPGCAPCVELDRFIADLAAAGQLPGVNIVKVSTESPYEFEMVSRSLNTPRRLFYPAVVQVRKRDDGRIVRSFVQSGRMSRERIHTFLLNGR